MTNKILVSSVFVWSAKCTVSKNEISVPQTHHHTPSSTAENTEGVTELPMQYFSEENITFRHC